MSAGSLQLDKTLRTETMCHMPLGGPNSILQRFTECENELKKASEICLLEFSCFIKSKGKNLDVSVRKIRRYSKEITLGRVFEFSNTHHIYCVQ